jgi:adenosine deaminase CECR1
MFGFDSMSLHGWRVLAEWSLEHSCMDVKEKMKALEFWRLQWDSFCVWIVEEFGAQYERSLVSHFEGGRLDSMTQV